MTKKLFGNLTTTCEMQVTTGFKGADGAYWPREITETFDPKGTGWLWRFHAINHENAMGEVN